MKDKGKENFTPKCIVNFITEIIEPFNGKFMILLGSGGCCSISKIFETINQVKAYFNLWTRSHTTTYKLQNNLAIRGIGNRSAQIHF